MAKKPVPPPGAPGWIVSYADMITVLLTFFVMLFAISSVDAGKANVVSFVMQDTFGSAKNTYILLPGGIWPSWQNSGAKGGRQMTSESIRNGNPALRNRIPMERPAEKIVFGTVYFEPDSANLTNPAKKELQETYLRLKELPLRVELRGHAGVRELGTSRDQMDLGYARAYSVRAYLVELGIKAERLVLTSVGQYEPETATPPSGMEEPNAFVEVILLSEILPEKQTKIKKL